MVRLRVPAGVMLGGRSVGGRFVSVAQLVAMAQTTTVDGALAIGALLERRKATRAAADQVAQIVADRLAPPRRRPPRRRRRMPEPFMPELEPVDAEWEYGIEYLAAKGRSSNLDINIRIARDDGRMMGQREAQQAFDAFRVAVGSRFAVALPAGYRFAAINWRRPAMHGAWRGGRFAGERQLADMLGPLVAYADDASRWTLKPGSESDI